MSTDSNSIKFLKSSDSKLRYDLNNNSRPALWAGVEPNAAKDNFTFEIVNGAIAYGATFPINLSGVLSYSFTSAGIFPEIINTDLGSTVKQFRDLHLSRDILLNGVIKIDGVQVVKESQAHINDPAGGATIDANARLVINAILNLLEAHGLMEP